MHCGQSLLAEQNDVADVFRPYGAVYRDQHKLTLTQYRVMSAIESCRTPAFGYHLDQCNDCGHIEKIFVLHTWGQTLWPHPHIHFIVPGGALTKDNQWVEPLFRDRFLFPVRALSKVFRGKFIEGLKSAYQKGDLKFPTEDINLTCPKEFDRWLDGLVSKKWVLYCKRPFKDARQVLRYIGRYTHRVAISNNRIFKTNIGVVGFQYKDYKSFKSGSSLRKTMVLTATEFVRRFLWHMLPSGFYKIRHYGFLANGCRIAVIRRIKSLLNANEEVIEEKSIYQQLCSKCKTGVLSTVCTLLRVKDRFKLIGRIPKIQFQFDSS